MYFYFEQPSKKEFTVKDFIDDIDKYDIIWSLDKLHIMYGEFHWAKDRKDFGFVNNVFCHVKNIENLDILDDGTPVVVTYKETPKGLQGESFDIVTNEDFHKMKIFAAEARAQEANEHRAACFQEEMKKWEKVQEINKSFGFYPIDYNHVHHNNYGCWDKHEFKFSREISRKEFISWLEAQGFNMVAPKVDAPVCDGYIDINGDGNDWAYKWTDVYYD